MLPYGDVKFMRTPQTVGTDLGAGTEAFGIVDRSGYDYATILLLQGITTVAAPAADDLLAVGHDDTVATAVTDATALTPFVGATDFTLPTPSSTHGSAYQFNIDCRGLKKYLCVGWETDGASFPQAIAILHRGDDGQYQTASTLTTADTVKVIQSGPTA